MTSTVPTWPTALPLLAESLAPGLQSLSRPALEALVTEQFGDGVSPEDVEGLFDDIGRGLSGAGRAVGQVAGRALPGVVQGAVSGAMVGGPWGALAGAALGGVSSALSSAPPKSAGGVIGQIAGTAGSFLGAAGGRAGGSAPAVPGPGVSPMLAGIGGSPALGQLLAVLGSPQAQQALRSMMLGRAGAPTVPTPNGPGTGVPVSLIANLLSGLATRAGEDAEAVGLVDHEAAEAFVVGLNDPDSPAQRHGLVLATLAPYPIVDGTSDGRAEFDDAYDDRSEATDDDYDDFDDWLLALAADDPSRRVF